MDSSSKRAPPPVNNFLQPDIYNRLDAETIERTRVANTQLGERLRAQERLLSKYRLDAERYHSREKARLRVELLRITDKLPGVHRIKDFRAKLLYDRYNSVPKVKVERHIRGIPEDKADMPFCERCFIHHLPTKKKYYKQPTPPPPIVAPAELPEAINSIVLEAQSDPPVPMIDDLNGIDSVDVLPQTPPKSVHFDLGNTDDDSLQFRQSLLPEIADRTLSPDAHANTRGDDSPRHKSPRQDSIRKGNEKTTLPPITPRVTRASSLLYKG